MEILDKCLFFVCTIMINSLVHDCISEGAIDIPFQHAIAEIFNFFQSSDHTQDTDMNALAMEKLSGVVKYSKDMLLYAIEQQSVGRSFVTLIYLQQTLNVCGHVKFFLKINSTI